jgi:hypothetical protein
MSKNNGIFHFTGFTGEISGNAYLQYKITKTPIKSGKTGISGARNSGWLMIGNSEIAIVITSHVIKSRVSESQITSGLAQRGSSARDELVGGNKQQENNTPHNAKFFQEKEGRHLTYISSS